jgi:hypothetical protein
MRRNGRALLLIGLVLALVAAGHWSWLRRAG